MLREALTAQHEVAEFGTYGTRSRAESYKGKTSFCYFF